MDVKMLTSIALLAVSLLCFSAAEAENPDKKDREREISLVPCKEQGPLTDNVQFFVILRQLEARLRDTEKQLEAKLRDTEKQLEDLKEEMKDDRVAFGASLGYGNTIGPFSTQITLTFNKVFFNTGEYNPSTGIFTAPVRGVYYFRFSGRNYSTRPMGLRLVKNGDMVVTVYNYATGSRYESATNGMTVQLEKGDQMYVRLDANTWVYDTIDAHSTFIGNLLFRL